MEAFTHEELYSRQVTSQTEKTISRYQNKNSNIDLSFIGMKYPLRSEYYNVDIFNENFKKILGHLGSTYISSKTTLGGIKVGNNLTITQDGTLNGNPKYEHPSSPEMRHVTDIEKASWNGKEDSFAKNSAHNKPFGLDEEEVLEGKHLNENLGSEYAGLISTPGVKFVGKTYYCGANKSIFLCKEEKDIDYIDLRYFTDFSHKGLLGKLENLSQETVKGFSGVTRKSYTFGSKILGVTANHNGGGIVSLNVKISGNTFIVTDNYPSAVSFIAIIIYNT